MRSEGVSTDDLQVFINKIYLTQSSLHCCHHTIAAPMR